MKRETLTEQLAAHRVNGDVLREMKADRAALVGDVKKLLDDAKAKYQDAAAMHAMGKVSYYGGQIDAFKKIMDLI